MTGDTQYEGDRNLATRIAFHENYTVPYFDFSRWVFDKIPFAAHQRVLEVGCGNGEFWSQNADRLPDGLRLTLTDLSQGMIEAASARLSSAGLVADYKVMSADALSFDINQFDVIVAKHMLYHVADRTSAFKHIKKTLKPGGLFCATTNSIDYMSELHALSIAQGIDWRTDTIGGFVLENGREQLELFFDEVIQFDLPGKLVITDAKAVGDYVKSVATLTQTPGRVFEKVVEVERTVAQIIESNGNFTVSKRAGIFLCR